MSRAGNGVESDDIFIQSPLPSLPRLQSGRQISMKLEAVILVAIGISSVFLVTVLIIAFMFRKYRRERRKKKMAGDAFR